MKRLLLVPLILALSLPSFADDHTYTYKGKTYKSNRLDKETLKRINFFIVCRSFKSLDKDFVQ